MNLFSGFNHEFASSISLQSPMKKVEIRPFNNILSDGIERN